MKQSELEVLKTLVEQAFAEARVSWEKQVETLLAQKALEIAADIMKPVLDAVKQLHEMEKAHMEKINSLKDGKDGTNGTNGTNGEDGKDAEPVDISVVEDSVLKMLPPLIPAAIPGEKGDQGDKGDTGAKGSDGVDGDKGADAAELNMVQVIEAVKAIYPSIRHDLAKALPVIEHKGVYELDEEYGKGDEVIKGDSSYRAKRKTRQAPPGDDWQCIAKSKTGRRGPDGEPGPVGDKGVGIEDIVVTDGNIVIKLTDGNTVLFDVEEELAKAVSQFMEKED